jgi:hypothetical protein
VQGLVFLPGSKKPQNFRHFAFVLLGRITRPCRDSCSCQDQKSRRISGTLHLFCWAGLLALAGTRVPARIKKAAEFSALGNWFVGQDYSPLQGLVFLPGSKKPQNFQHLAIGLLGRITRPCRDSCSCRDQKKPRISEAFVIPAGFEPATHSLEGCCSIQLSYETIC